MSQIFWRQKADAPRGLPCLFLDRDGVLVEEVGYLHRPEHVRVLPGASELIRAARARGYAIGVVTNQAGVGRGYYDWSAFVAVQTELTAKLDRGPEPFDFVAACGAHPDATIEHLRIADHPWRKPAAGMLTMAASALQLDLGRSVIVGDQVTDLEAGRAAGVGRLVHVLTGHGAENRSRAEAFAAGLCDGGSRVFLANGLVDLPALLEW